MQNPREVLTHNLPMRTRTRLIEIGEVHQLFEARQPDGTAERAAVNRWLARRRIPLRSITPKERLFERRDVIAMLDADYPDNPERLLSVHDAFRLARRVYPHPKDKRP